MAKDFVNITKFLKEYTEEVTRAITEEAIELGKLGAKKLKVISPKKTGKYSKGWKTSLKKGSNFINVKIHNKNPQLTHLLEHGHAKRGGGRTRAFPHIKPVEEEVNKEFEKKVIEIIKRGGK